MYDGLKKSDISGGLLLNFANMHSPGPAFLTLLLGRENTAVKSEIVEDRAKLGGKPSGFGLLGLFTPCQASLLHLLHQRRPFLGHF